MQSVSLFEQLTRNVPVSIVSGAVLALILILTIACRVFFFSTKSKQHTKNEKKSTTKKQPIEVVSGNKKKTTKAKKNVAPVSSPSTQSEESEEEKATLVPPTKKAIPSNQVSKDKKVVATNDNKKTVTSTKQTPVNNNDVQEKSGDNKKKQSKTSAVPTTSGKGDATKKVNAPVSDKKQPVMTSSEMKRAPAVDGEGLSDQEDEGQWVTQSNKQVNNRNRNKGNKTETSPSALAYHPTLSEKRSVPTTSSTSAPSNKVEVADVEPTPPPPPREPIEICQLVSKAENRYTANDDWWRHALNHKQTFSVNDIGEWPEREQDEQYIVQVKRIVPV